MLDAFPDCHVEVDFLAQVFLPFLLLVGINPTSNYIFLYLIPKKNMLSEIFVFSLSNTNIPVIYLPDFTVFPSYGENMPVVPM